MIDYYILAAVKIVGAITVVLILLAMCQALAWWLYRNIVGWPTIVDALDQYRKNRVVAASDDLHSAMSKAGMIKPNT
ncbi:hypothetical protein, partial [Streptococcus pneumoniae]|uniref:hypothetical protein n=1 Tax=Streptococcus pneumoniae TaxID=1313 RepID=UPI001E639984